MQTTHSHNCVVNSHHLWALCRWTNGKTMGCYAQIDLSGSDENTTFATPYDGHVKPFVEVIDKQFITFKCRENEVLPTVMKTTLLSFNLVRCIFSGPTKLLCKPKLIWVSVRSTLG